ncbi:hypothetical protein K3722_00475 [Leisingera caerulea]|uniref:Uncharacterized protein n=1 Tax=Leisingera caerulea TaxID=506591 RepID=A0ABY5WWZ9_LEICA|nr:hypothetical protein [Leisingera caerulea]UWQ58643.1 hypothetical protein K3722_00475 [Leisingera caerulea]
MKDTVELPAELAVLVGKTLLATVDELSAQYLIKYGHLKDVTNPFVLKKIEQDDQLRQDLIPVLRDLVDLLEREGFRVLPDTLSEESK